MSTLCPFKCFKIPFIIKIFKMAVMTAQSKKEKTKPTVNSVTHMHTSKHGAKS